MEVFISFLPDANSLLLICQVYTIALIKVKALDFSSVWTKEILSATLRCKIVVVAVVLSHLHLENSIQKLKRLIVPTKWGSG